MEFWKVSLQHDLFFFFLHPHSHTHFLFLCWTADATNRTSLGMIERGIVAICLDSLPSMDPQRGAEMVSKCAISLLLFFLNSVTNMDVNFARFADATWFRIGVQHGEQMVRQVISGWKDRKIFNKILWTGSDFFFKRNSLFSQLTATWESITSIRLLTDKRT